MPSNARNSWVCKVSWVTAWLISKPALMVCLPFTQVRVSRNCKECCGRRLEKSAGPGVAPKSVAGPQPQKVEHWKKGKQLPPPRESVCGRLKAMPNSLSNVALRVWFQVPFTRKFRLVEGEICPVATPYCVLV